MKGASNKRAMRRYNRIKTRQNRGKPIFKWSEPSRVPPWLRKQLKG